MGFFNKKKNSTTSASVLSESEIQKKLYGEFSTGETRVEVGERDHFDVPATHPIPVKSPIPGHEAPADLFSTSNKEALIDPDLPPRPSVVATKTAEHASRYVPLHDFENKAAISSSPSASDPYARFRYNRPASKKMEAFWAFVKESLNKALDPKQVALRRFFYWGAAILVVFLLFWGVNSLNSQREEAMRTRYKIPSETVSATAKVPAATVVSSEPVAERPVVITPAPVRPKKSRASDVSGRTAASVNGSYVIQVVTYPTRQDADQVVDSFKRVGLSAFVQEDTRPSGRLFYVVFLGGFRTEAEAQAALIKFRAKEVARPFQDSFVRARRS